MKDNKNHKSRLPIITFVLAAGTVILVFGLQMISFSKPDTQEENQTSESIENKSHEDEFGIFEEVDRLEQMLYFFENEQNKFFMFDTRNEFRLEDGIY